MLVTLIIQLWFCVSLNERQYFTTSNRLWQAVEDGVLLYVCICDFSIKCQPAHQKLFIYRYLLMSSKFAQIRQNHVIRKPCTKDNCTFKQTVSQCCGAILSLYWKLQSCIHITDIKFVNQHWAAFAITRISKL